MRCNNCGWNNPDHLTRCQKCNQPLEPVFGEAGETGAASPATPKPAPTHTCSKCGYPVPTGLDYCPNCGCSIASVDTRKTSLLVPPTDDAADAADGVAGIPSVPDSPSVGGIAEGAAIGAATVRRFSPDPTPDGRADVSSTYGRGAGPSPAPHSPLGQEAAPSSIGKGTVPIRGSEQAPIAADAAPAHPQAPAGGYWRGTVVDFGTPTRPTPASAIPARPAAPTDTDVPAPQPDARHMLRGTIPLVLDRDLGTRPGATPLAPGAGQADAGQAPSGPIVPPPVPDVAPPAPAAAVPMPDAAADGGWRYRLQCLDDDAHTVVTLSADSALGLTRGDIVLLGRLRYTIITTPNE